MTGTERTLFDISGKVALVTGGSSGIGEMIAGTLLRSGVRVFIVGRKRERLDAAVERLSGFGTIAAIEADLAAETGAAQVVAALRERSDRLDILVNNAGATWGEPFASFSAAGWNRVMDLNVRGTFLLTQALTPILAASATEQDWSRVINLSSVGARHTGEAPSVAYGPSKAAVEQLTRVMARWLGPHRVTANCIAPGWFPSRMNAPLPQAYREAWLKDTPCGRLGTADDIGGLAVFLASRGGAFVNGQVISIDGGWSA